MRGVNVPASMLDLTQDELEAMPTIHNGQFGNLKIEEGSFRLWHSRMTRADGAKFNHAAEIEFFDGNRWEEVHSYQPR